MIAILRDGRTVEVAEHRGRYSVTWQRDVTDFILTPDGGRIEAWQIRRFEESHPALTTRSLTSYRDTTMSTNRKKLIDLPQEGGPMYARFQDADIGKEIMRRALILQVGGSAMARAANSEVEMAVGELLVMFGEDLTELVEELDRILESKEPK